MYSQGPKSTPFSFSTITVNKSDLVTDPFNLEFRWRTTINYLIEYGKTLVFLVYEEKNS